MTQQKFKFTWELCYTKSSGRNNTAPLSRLLPYGTTWIPYRSAHRTLFDTTDNITITPTDIHSREKSNNKKNKHNLLLEEPTKTWQKESAKNHYGLLEAEESRRHHPPLVIEWWNLTLLITIVVTNIDSVAILIQAKTNSRSSTPHVMVRHQGRLEIDHGSSTLAHALAICAPVKSTPQNHAWTVSFYLLQPGP